MLSVRKLTILLIACWMVPGLCKDRKHQKKNVDTVGSASNCSTDYVPCPSGNGVCIRPWWFCDYDNDCGDNSDERNCSRPTCNPTTQFRCANERCINRADVCDGSNNCRDNTDENNCTACTSVAFHCASERRCIRSYWRCDFGNDCADGSDEANCQYPTCNPLTQHTCTNGRCISLHWVCDGDNDCGDRSDETNCASCRPSQFHCNSGECIYNSYTCNRRADCADGSDERNCVYPTCHPDYQFTCKTTGECVPDFVVCDGYDHCSDRTDEDGCPNCASLRNETECVSRQQQPILHYYHDQSIDFSNRTNEFFQSLRNAPLRNICSELGNMADCYDMKLFWADEECKTSSSPWISYTYNWFEDIVNFVEFFCEDTQLNRLIANNHCLINYDLLFRVYTQCIIAENASPSCSEARVVPCAVDNLGTAGCTADAQQWMSDVITEGLKLNQFQGQLCRGHGTPGPRSVEKFFKFF